MFDEKDLQANEGQEGVVDPQTEKVDELDSGVDLPDIKDDDEDSNIDLQSETQEPDELEDETQMSDEKDGEFEEGDDETEEPQQEEPPKQKQTPEENSAFAKLRRKEEELAKREASLREAEMQRKLEEDMLSPEKIWDYAEEHGITEEMARKFLKQEAQLKSQQMKVDYEARQTRVLQQKEELKKNPLYQHLETEVDEVLQQNPDVDAKVAFDYVVGKNSHKISEIFSKNAEKRTLANVQDKMKRRGIGRSDSSESSNHTSLLGSDEMDMTMAFGNNPNEIAKYVKKESKRLRR